MLMFPEFNPVAFSVGPVAVYWYGLAYMGGFLGGLWHCLWLLKRQPLTGFDRQAVDALFIYIVLGIILGGRLGFVLFYDLGHFLAHPAQIFMTWQGGMAFHGGAIGVALAIVLFCWRKKLHPIDVAERVIPGVPIGIFLGRMANFINGELWGRPTELPWGMVFPHVDALARHPSMLYEAALEGVVLYLLIWWFGWRNGVRRWRNTGIFLLGYGVARFMVEFVRAQDPQFAAAGGVYDYLSQGQLLSLPMIAAGLACLYLAKRHAR
jgi:phosphatidylglycerol:prolipoprotein diacylglycerol transferase